MANPVRESAQILGGSIAELEGLVGAGEYCLDVARHAIDLF